MSTSAPTQTVTYFPNQPQPWQFTKLKQITRQTIGALPATFERQGVAREQAEEIVLAATLDFIADTISTWPDRKMQVANIALELTRRINAALPGQTTEAEVQHG